MSKEILTKSFYNIEKQRYEKSGIPMQVKDIDKKQGIVIFYASIWNKVDSDGDITHKGAFKKTLQENFSRFRHLKDHINDIGVILKDETFEDNIGLRVGSQLFKNGGEWVQESKEIFIRYEVYADNSIKMEHSYGFKPIKEEKREDGYNHLLENKVWEFTTMTKWGAQEFAQQIDTKSNDDIGKEIMVLKELLNGEFNKEKLEEFEIQLNILKSLVNDEPLISTQKDEPNLNNILNECKLFKID